MYGTAISSGRQAPTLVATLTPTSEISWIDAASPAQADGYALVVVDPIGRRSQLALTEPRPP